MEVNCLHSNNRKKNPSNYMAALGRPIYKRNGFKSVRKKSNAIVFGISSKANTPSVVHAMLLYLHKSMLRILLTENYSMYKSFGMLLYLNENSS